MKLLHTTLLLIACSFIIKAQEVVSISDTAFEKSLLRQGIDSDGELNGQVFKHDVDTLKRLFCFNAGISSLEGIAAFDSLEELYSWGNNLITLDLSANSKLERLYCGRNELIHLALPHTSTLREIYCGDNKLRDITLDSLSGLELFNCSYSQVLNLDLSQCPNLKRLVCSENFLSSLDLSENHLLEELVCHNNPFNHFPLSGMDSLKELNISECYLTVLDIKDCPNLKSLRCNGNRFQEIDLSPFPLLEHFYCADNQWFMLLNISKNSLLKTLYLNDSYLAPEIDYSLYPNLRSMWRDNSNLFRLDLTQNTKLEYLTFNNNGVSGHLDLSASDSLRRLSCNDNKLISIRLPDSSIIERLDCSNNDIEVLQGRNVLLNVEHLDCSHNRLGLFHNLEKIVQLDCQYNRLHSLDLSQCSQLRFLKCNNNELRTLNVRNGNNHNIPDNLFDARNNPRLLCIEVDDVQDATPRFRNHDQHTGLSIDCEADTISIPDTAFERALIEQYVDTDRQLNGRMLRRDAVFRYSLDLEDRGIRDLSGIEHFAQLNTLHVPHNMLTELDVSQLKELVTINCDWNNIQSLDVSNNKKLNWLNCGFNALESLNVRNENNRNFRQFNALVNPDLYCVEVDEINYSRRHWSLYVSSRTSFSLDCSDEVQSYLPPTISKAAATNWDFVLFPNPVDDELNIVTNNSSTESFTAAIYDLLGRKISEVQVKPNKQFKMNIRQLVPGSYFLELDDGNRSSRKKFVKSEY